MDRYIIIGNAEDYEGDFVIYQTDDLRSANWVLKELRKVEALVQGDLEDMHKAIELFTDLEQEHALYLLDSGRDRYDLCGMEWEVYGIYDILKLK